MDGRLCVPARSTRRHLEEQRKAHAEAQPCSATIAVSHAPSILRRSGFLAPFRRVIARPFDLPERSILVDGSFDASIFAQRRSNGPPSY